MWSAQAPVQNSPEDAKQLVLTAADACQWSLGPPRRHTPLECRSHRAQLGALASLELSLRSWLRLARRSLRSVSSWVRSVCPRTRRDSLCSTLR